MRKAIVFFVLFTACSNYELVTIDGQALGTYYRVKYLDIDYPRENLQKGIDSILKVIKLTNIKLMPKIYIFAR